MSFRPAKVTWGDLVSKQEKRKGKEREEKRKENLEIAIRKYLHAFTSSLDSKSGGAVSKGRKGAKTSGTAAKVALMKLKMHADGDKSLPQVKQASVSHVPRSPLFLPPIEYKCEPDMGHL